MDGGETVFSQIESGSLSMEQLNKLLADIREVCYRTYGATIFDMLGNGGKETI